MWGSAKAWNTARIQWLESEVLRTILNAPWFASNKTNHNNLNIPPITEFAKTRFRSFHSKSSFYNPLVQTLSFHYHPLRPPRWLKCQWPRDLLWVRVMWESSANEWLLSSSIRVIYVALCTFDNFAVDGRENKAEKIKVYKYGRSILPGLILLKDLQGNKRVGISLYNSLIWCSSRHGIVSARNFVNIKTVYHS